MEEEMATHSNVLARRIPWTEEPGGVQSMVIAELILKRLSNQLEINEIFCILLFIFSLPHLVCVLYIKHL